MPEKHSSCSSPWKTTSTRTAYQNSWIRVREDHVIRPDGTPGLYGVVEIRPSVGVVALNARDEVVLVGQWRYALNRHSWEIPRGGSSPGETDMLLTAQRELAEEAGVKAANWELLGPVDVCRRMEWPTMSKACFWLPGCRKPPCIWDPEEDIIVEWKPFAEAVKMAMDGRITEVCSIAALLMVNQRRK